MAKRGMLANNSYEVFTKDGSRWLLDAPFPKKFAAIKKIREEVRYAYAHTLLPYDLMAF